MKKIKFNSINTKIMLSYLIIISLFLVMGLFSYLGTQEINDNTEDMIDEQVNVLILEHNLTQNIIESTASISDYFYIGDVHYKNKYNDLKEEREKLVQQLSNDTSFDRTGNLLSKYNQWERVIASAIVDFDDGYDFVAFNALSRAKPLAEEIALEMKDISLQRENAIKERGYDIVQAGEQTLYSQLVIGVLILLITVLLAVFSSRSITKPIISIMKELYRLAKGDLSKKEIHIKSKNDEIIKLTESANHMSYQLREMIEQIQNLSNAVSIHSDELKNTSNQINSAQKHVTSMMDELATGAEDQVAYSNEIVTLMDRFAKKIEEANDNGGRVQRRTNRVMNMTNEGKALLELSTKQMYTINDTLQDSMEKMGRLHNYTKDISNVITAIKGIAEQTNLLSLNATIEAARAGEHGKGFSVVAEQVRKLSDEVTELVGNTDQIISNVQTESLKVVESLQYSYGEVEKGMGQIVETEQKFNMISQAIEEAVDSLNTIMNNLVDFTNESKEMYQSIERIASISEEFSSGVEETSASTQQTSEVVHELSISSDQLTDLVNELNTIVGRFKLEKKNL